MFKIPTVIIIGAGASKDFNYPLGPDLLSTIINGLVSASNRLKASRYIDTTVPNVVDFLGLRYQVLYNLAAAKKHDIVPYSHVQLDEFVEAAQGQTLRSIDRFLRDHQEHSEVGKFLIAFELVCCSYQRHADSGRVALNDFSKPSNLHWISGLINEIREGAMNAEELKSNNLTIVTFNYDDVLERAFDAQMENTSRHKGANWREFIKIEHVYGSLKKLPVNPNTHTLFEAAHAIAPELGYIHEQTGIVKFNERVDRLRDTLRNAQRIISLGFSFDQANVELLALDKRVGRNMIALNYDGNIGLQSTLESFGAKEYVHHDRAVPTTIGKAIELGILQFQRSTPLPHLPVIQPPLPFIKRK
ncbi:MAG: hypothetical protein ABI230_03630 [Aestuariivirga sp.]